MASDDPEFEEKAADIIGLYLKPPAHAAVFCVEERHSATDPSARNTGALTLTIWVAFINRHHRLNHLLWIMPFALLPKKCKIVLDVRSLDEVPAIILPVKGRLGHRLIEPGQEGLRIDGLYLDLEWLQFSLKRLGNALQSMLKERGDQLPLAYDGGLGEDLLDLRILRTPSPHLSPSLPQSREFISAWIIQSDVFT